MKVQGTMTFVKQMMFNEGTQYECKVLENKYEMILSQRGFKYTGFRGMRYH